MLGAVLRAAARPAAVMTRAARRAMHLSPREIDHLQLAQAG